MAKTHEMDKTKTSKHFNAIYYGWLHNCSFCGRREPYALYAGNMIVCSYCGH